MKKFKDYIILGILVLVIFGFIWAILEPIIWWTEYSEIRICVRLFLVMFAVSTFSVLRLYNAVVQNTRFSIKLRDVFISFYRMLPNLERAMKNLNSTLGNVKASSDLLKKSISENTGSVDTLNNKISKIN